jgi:hypothetical protein
MADTIDIGGISKFSRFETLHYARAQSPSKVVPESDNGVVATRVTLSGGKADIGWTRLDVRTSASAPPDSTVTTGSVLVVRHS